MLLWPWRRRRRGLPLWVASLNVSSAFGFISASVAAEALREQGAHLTHIAAVIDNCAGARRWARSRRETNSWSAASAGGDFYSRLVEPACGAGGRRVTALMALCW